MKITFDDVLLTPNKSLPSRNTASLKTKLCRGLELDSVILSANMDTVTESAMMNTLASLGCLGVLHRNQKTVEDQVNEILIHKEYLKNELKCEHYPIAVAIGLIDYESRVKALVEAGATVIVVDIAHGHSDSVSNVVKHIKDTYKDSVKVIAGNVATGEGALFLAKAGADAIKVGIGPGCLCGNSKILMSDGSYKLLKHVTVGDFVLDSTGNPKRVKNVISSGYGSTISLTHEFSPKPLKITRGHKIYANNQQDLEWVNVEDLKDHYLSFPKRLNLDLDKNPFYLEPILPENVGIIVGRYICLSQIRLCDLEKDFKDLNIKHSHLSSLIARIVKLTGLSEGKFSYKEVLFKDRDYLKSLLNTCVSFKSQYNYLFKELNNVEDLCFVLKNFLGFVSETEPSTQLVDVFSKSETDNSEIELYDLEIDSDSPSFIADNVIVHNSMCTTRIVTGFGVPQLDAIVECKKALESEIPFKDIPIIADGGIKSSGDIVKALYFGADTVMLGSLLSGSSCTPGEVILDNGNEFKRYYGMASHNARRVLQNDLSSDFAIEGESTLVPYKGSTKDIVKQLLAGVRSGMSYGGSETISKLRDSCTYSVVSNNSVRENIPHGKK